MTSSNSESVSSLVHRARMTHVWSQEQLAQMAGISLRTVQRIESGQACSAESIKALASVLEMDASRLQDAAPAFSNGRLHFGLSADIALYSGIVLCLPALLFVGINLAFYEMGVVQLAVVIDSSFWDTATANTAAGVIVLGGPLLAGILNLPHLLSLQLRRDSSCSPDATVINGLVVHRKRGQWLLFSLCIVLLGIMVIYGTVENLGHLLDDLAA